MSDDNIIKQALAVLAREEARATPLFTRVVHSRPAPRRCRWRAGAALAATMASMAIVLALLFRPIVEPELAVMALPLEPLVAPLNPELSAGAPDFESSLRLAREFAGNEVPL